MLFSGWEVAFFSRNPERTPGKGGFGEAWEVVGGVVVIGEYGSGS